jgi:hypothetical protein
VFVAIGVATHDASVGAFARDALCFLGAWFAIAVALRLYSRDGLARLAVTWLAGVSLAVAVRAAIVGHLPGAFYAVALVFTALLVGAARALPGLSRPPRRPRPEEPS